MCYLVYISTTSPEDLAALSTALVRFEPADPQDHIVAALAYDHKWHVGSAAACSCAFRHATTAELGFGKPEDWYPEEPQDLQATAAFIALVRRLVEAGEHVDSIDAWAGAEPAGLHTMRVDLHALANDEFRFFENHHFLFV